MTDDFVLLNDIRSDFIKANGDDGLVDVRKEYLNGEVLVVVESLNKRHYYSLKVQPPDRFILVQVQNL